MHKLFYSKSLGCIALDAFIAGISDHDAIFVKAKITPKATRPPRRKIFLYTKADFSAINEKITAFWL